MRQADKRDFYVGSKLVDSEKNEFVIYEKYGEGMWEARGEGGCKVVFECEAQFYSVQDCFVGPALMAQASHEAASSTKL